MIDTILIILEIYLIIGQLFAIVGIVIMFLDENKLMTKLGIIKIIAGYIGVTLKWPWVLWDLIRIHKHRDEIRDFADKLEKRK